MPLRIIMLHHTLSWLPPCPAKPLCAAAKVLSGPCRQQDPGRAHRGPQEEPLLFQQKFRFSCILFLFCAWQRDATLPQPSKLYSVAQQPRTCWEGSFAAVNPGWRGKWGDVTPKTCCLGCPSSKVPTSRCRSVAARTLVAMSAEEQRHCTFCSSASGLFWSV